MREIEDIIRKLRRHFGTVTVHPPAGEAVLRDLCERIPTVPDELLSFWRYCDGLCVIFDESGELFGVERSLLHYPVGEVTDLLGRLVPLRGDGCGDYDCLVVGAGPCEGAVVFWDHDIYDGAAYLLGGSLLGYLEMWTDRIVHENLPSGEKDPRCRPPKLDAFPWLGTPEYRHPWPFDEAWMRGHDPAAARLLADETSRRWLLRQGG